MKNIKVRLCKNCANGLKEYNPYIDKQGNTIPIENIEIKLVSVEKCDNYTVDGIFVNLKE